jgi:hypothetical protein
MIETKTENWMETVLEEHRELRLMIAELREFLRRPRPVVGEPGAHSWASELSQWLVKLHDGLFRHFRYEEQSGMAEEITLRHPRTSHEVDRLMAEHPQMLKEVRSLMAEALDYSEGHLLDDPALRTRLENVLDQLAEHECEETKLIQLSELLEIGVGD